MTSQDSSTARAAVRKNRTSEVAVVPLPEENSGSYNVSYSSRFRRDCTSKCRLANVLLPIKVGGGFPPSCFRPLLSRS